MSDITPLTDAEIFALKAQHELAVAPLLSEIARLETILAARRAQRAKGARL